MFMAKMIRNQRSYVHVEWVVSIKTTQVKAIISWRPSRVKVEMRGMNAPHTEVAQEAKHLQESPMGGIAGIGPDKLTDQR